MQDKFTPSVLFCADDPVRFLAYNASLLVACLQQRFFVFQSESASLRLDDSLEWKCTGLSANGESISAMLSNGTLVRYSVSGGCVTERVEMANQLIESELLPDVFVGGEQRTARYV